MKTCSKDWSYPRYAPPPPPPSQAWTVKACRLWKTASTQYKHLPKAQTMKKNADWKRGQAKMHCEGHCNAGHTLSPRPQKCEDSEGHWNISHTLRLDHQSVQRVWLKNSTYTHTYAHAHTHTYTRNAPNMHAHADIRHAHTRTHTHVYSHTHTYTRNAPNMHIHRHTACAHMHTHSCLLAYPHIHKKCTQHALVRMHIHTLVPTHKKCTQHERMRTHTDTACSCTHTHMFSCIPTHTQEMHPTCKHMHTHTWTIGNIRAYDWIHSRWTWISVFWVDHFRGTNCEVTVQTVRNADWLRVLGDLHLCLFTQIPGLKGASEFYPPGKMTSKVFLS